MKVHAETDCQFCNIVATAKVGDAYWVRSHPKFEAVSFRPFGALDPAHRMFVSWHHIVSAATNSRHTGELFRLAAHWAATEEEGVDFNLVVNSGPDADQTVPHLHVHYVPRRPGDGLGYRWEKP